MNNLILKTRLDVLAQSIELVGKFEDSIADSRKDVQCLLDHLTSKSAGFQTSASTIRRLVNEASEASSDLEFQVTLDNEQRQLLSVISNALSTAAIEVNTLYEHIKRARRTIDVMRNRSVSLDALDKLKSTLNGGTQNWINAIDAIRRDKVNEAQGRYEAGEVEAAEELLQKAWREYLLNVYEQSLPILGEYVDFLGGLALRDMSFDKGICRIADQLIVLCADQSDILWSSLTIPARQEAVNMTVARIIRLGFPEWSLWTLPLTAHEFGHVLVSEKENKIDTHTRTNPHTNNAPDTPIFDVHHPHIQEYLADVFATYSMGPAYACAAILLRFDPFLAFKDTPESPATAKRAHVIMAVLAKMNQDSRADIPPYDGIGQLLNKEWNAAIRQVGEDGTFSDEDKVQLDALVGCAWNYLEKNTTVKYLASSWSNIIQWSLDIRAGQDSKVKLGSKRDPRDIINAAWMARVDDVGKTLEIADAALALWNQLSSSDQSAGLAAPVPQRN